MLLTHPATPNENRFVEVSGKILMRRVKILLVQAKLPESFLGYALTTTAYSYNLQFGRAEVVRAKGFYDREVTHHQLRVVASPTDFFEPTSLHQQDALAFLWGTGLSGEDGIYSFSLASGRAKFTTSGV